MVGWEVTVAVSATGGGGGAGGGGGGGRRYRRLGVGGVVLSRNIAAVQWVLPPVNFMLKCVS